MHGPGPAGPAGSAGGDGSAGHVLGLHASWRERVPLISSWVREGLARGEQVVCVQPEGEERASLHQAVSSGVVDWSAARVRGQVAVVSARQALPADGVFDLGSLRMRALGVIDRALAAGYHGLRVMTVGAPLLDAVPDEATWLAVERDIERLCHEQPLSVLCQYNHDVREAVRRAAAALHRRIVESLVEITVVGAVVRLRGEIDISNCTLLESAVNSACRDADTRVDLDLTDLLFLDVSGCRALASGTAALRGRSGSRVILHNPVPGVARVLRLLRVNELPGVELREGRSA